MHKHESGKTRITLERVTVTTTRRGLVPQPIYCEICKQLIDPGTEPMLLKAGIDPNDKNIDEETPIELIRES